MSVTEKSPLAAKYAKETFWAVASKGAAFFFYYALLYYLTRRMTVDMWGEWSAFLALLNIILFDEQHNEAANGYGGAGGSANGGHCFNK